MKTLPCKQQVQNYGTNDDGHRKVKKFGLHCKKVANIFIFTV